MRRMLAVILAMAAMCGCQVAFSTVGTWTREASPPAPLPTNNVVALADGRVAMFGGIVVATNQYAKQTVLYNPATRSWGKGAPMPGPGDPDVVVALPDGNVLVEGGTDPHGNISGSTWLYDATRDSWTQAGNVIEPRSGPSYTLLSGGRLMILGGGVPLPQPITLPNGTQVNFEAVASAEIFDPVTGVWSQAGRLQAPLSGISLAALSGGAALAAGGCTGGAGFTPPVPTAEVFDPVALAWTMTTPVPIAICGATAVGLRDGRALVIDQSLFAFPYGFQFSASDDSFVYDPKTGHWTAAGGLAGGGAIAVTLKDGRVLVPEVEQGAPKGRVFMESVGGQIFDPSTNQWTFATTTTVPLSIAFLFQGGNQLAASLQDGTVLLLLQLGGNLQNTVALTYHPQVAPPAADVLDSTGLTAELVVALAVIVVLLLLAYRRAGRIEMAKLQ